MAELQDGRIWIDRLLNSKSKGLFWWNAPCNSAAHESEGRSAESPHQTVRTRCFQTPQDAARNAGGRRRSISARKSVKRRQSQGWLEFIRDGEMSKSPDLARLCDESSQLRAIFVAANLTARGKG
jgi:hypothetical protein